jgi:glycine/D-amino acid oxidase-like deaminating enzyme
LNSFPCWLIADETYDGVFYGFPSLGDGFDGPAGVKLAHHYPGESTKAEEINRSITERDQSMIEYSINKHFPGELKSIAALKTCMYTNTLDENFIIDYLPGHGNDVVVASGFSGHGFKFASVVGEILCDLAGRGSTRFPIEFLSARRFL